jgi:cytochrome c553
MNRTSSLAAVLLALVAGSSPAFAQEAAAAKPDLAKAEQTAKAICAACHGADGNSAVSANPNLAGQGALYITHQLSNFKDDIRLSPIMGPIAKTLSPEDMTALGVYFSKQKPKGLAARDPKLVAAGQTLYRAGDAATGLPACAACHSPSGAGIPKNFPRLAGQYSDYTYAQLTAFKTGQRGNDPNGKDVNGRIMAGVASRMTDTQMKALADYTAGLR